MQHFTTEISGMSGQHCVDRVKKAIAAVPGAKADSVIVGSATISFDDKKTSEEAISQAIRAAGY